MSEVKKFTITGEIKKGKTKVPFSVEFNAMKEEDALQRLYSEMGSRHRARRFEIKIMKIRSAREEAAQAKG
ncbi:MAG: 50S ribosomal protein L18Ae [Candidatus Bathyarchaeia archaeon]|jgi:large subunit ribosomal protein LX